MKKLIFLLALLFAALVAIQASNAADANPGIPDKYKDYKWHRFETENFEILSIDRNQGESMKKYVEKIKTWANLRWSMPDLPYKNKCMVIATTNNEMYNEFFKAKDIDPRVAKSKNMDGSDRDVFVIYIAGEPGFESASLPEKIGRVNILNYEANKGVQFPYWLSAGMSELNNDVNTIRKVLGNAPISKSMKPSKEIFEMTPPNVDAMADSHANAAIMCLFLRKQHKGGERMANVVNSLPKDTSSVATIFEFASPSEFDAAFGTYAGHLLQDIQASKTPDMGLTWFVAPNAKDKK